MLSAALFAVLSAVAAAHEHAGDPSVYLAAQGPHKQSFWYRTLPGDGKSPLVDPLSATRNEQPANQC